MPFPFYVYKNARIAPSVNDPSRLFHFFQEPKSLRQPFTVSLIVLRLFFVVFVAHTGKFCLKLSLNLLSCHGSAFRFRDLLCRHFHHNDLVSNAHSFLPEKSPLQKKAGSGSCPPLGLYCMVPTRRSLASWASFDARTNAFLSFSSASIQELT